MTTTTNPQPCIVLADDRGSLTWLGQFPTLDEATSAMSAWLSSGDRDVEDAAFIVPVLGFGRRR